MRFQLTKKFIATINNPVIGKLERYSRGSYTRLLASGAIKTSWEEYSTFANTRSHIDDSRLYSHQSLIAAQTVG